MKGKYNNSFKFTLAKINRWFLRQSIRNLITWENTKKSDLKDGCTVILGMCSKLPQVLEGNLRCLYHKKWQDIKEVFIIVDAEKSILSDNFEEKIKNKFPEFQITFFFYNHKQYKTSQKLKLPFYYSWMSWCIGLKHTKTKVVLIHDYDALILSKYLENRYQQFINEQNKIQGIKAYRYNGFVKDDFLVTTFEAFVDVSWVRSFAPIQLFNRIGIYQNRTVDYDTLLFLQAKYLSKIERKILPMNCFDLVHPSQMIHQYTMFQKFPGKSLPCFSIIMIPLFNFLSGDDLSFGKAAEILRNTGGNNCVDFLSDGSLINFSQLNIVQVDWALKQIIQAFISLQIKPFSDLINYGTCLYQLCKTPEEKIWLGDFTEEQKQWINLAKKKS